MDGVSLGWSVALVLAAGLLLLLTTAWRLQRGLIYFPDSTVPPTAGAVLPGSEDVSFVTGDGLRLAGWFLPAHGGTNRGTVLVCNGNAGSRMHRAPLASALNDEGLAVMLFDYRGYGGNSGSPAAAGLLTDVRAARTYLVSRPDVDPTRLIYYGESLGTALAVGLAAEQPPAALILQSPFPSLTAVGRLHYWVLPVGLLPRDRFPAGKWIRRVRVPTLVIAGAHDRLIPPEMSRRFCDAAPGPSHFVLVPGADHHDRRLTAGIEARAAVRHFLAVAVGLV